MRHVSVVKFPMWTTLFCTVLALCFGAKTASFNTVWMRGDSFIASHLDNTDYKIVKSCFKALILQV